MTPSLLRLLGVLLGSAGFYLAAEGSVKLGLALAAAGVIVVLTTARLPFARFGPWRPGGHAGVSARDGERLREGAETRMRDALPGNRRSRESVVNPETRKR